MKIISSVSILLAIKSRQDACTTILRINNRDFSLQDLELLYENFEKMYIIL